MNRKKPTYRRRIVLVDRDFQLRFIGRFAGLLLFYLVLFLIISMVAPVGISLLGGSDDWAMMETAFRVDVLLRMVLAPLLCTFLCVFAHGVLETFRVAGPHYRFRQVFKDLKGGTVPRGVKIRKDDYLQETCRAFDGALVSLHDRIGQMQGQSRRLSHLMEAASSGDPEAVQAAAQAQAELHQALHAFELVGGAPGNQPLSPAGEDSSLPVEPVAAEPSREPVAS